MDTLVNALVGGRNIDSRVAGEEVIWLHGESANLDRHDREIFDSDQMSNTKGEPHNDISVNNGLSLLGPLWQTVFTVRLIAVETTSKELVLLVRSDPEGLGGKTSSSLDNRSRLGHERGVAVRNNLETNRVLGVRVLLALVDDLPETSSGSVSHSLAFNGILQDGILGVETVSVQVVRVTDRFLNRLGINLSNGVVGSVNHGINTHGEEMLMVLSVDLGSNHGTESTGSLILSKNVSVDFTSSLDFVVDGTILVQVPVASIIVVGNWKEDGTN